MENKFKNIRKILAVRLDNIGDVIMLGPALRALKEAFNGPQITLMASPAGAQAARLLPWVDDVFTLSPAWQDIKGEVMPDLDRELELVRRVREGLFDAAFIFTSFGQSPYPPAYICYMAQVPLRLAQSKEFGGNLLTHWIKPLADHVHQTQRNLHLLEQVGIPVVQRDLEIAIPSAVQVQADALLKEEGIDPFGPFIFLAPGASCLARRYDTQRFAEVVELLNQDVPYPIVLGGSPKEIPLSQTIMDRADPFKTVSLVGKTSLLHLAAVINRASLVIANNSGSLHLADALQKPMVLLYSGTEHEQQWSPRKSPYRLLRVPTSCSPCYYFQCPWDMPCLDIAPQRVAQEVILLLSQVQALA